MNKIEARNKAMIDRMVNRFLSWKLPKDFSPDGGMSFNKTYYGIGGVAKTRKYEDAGWWPIGTNLLSADQAKDMIMYMLAEEEK